MATRRGRGEGSISRRADGRWVARVDLGRDLGGKRRRRAVYGATRAEAARKLAALLSRVVLTTSTPTVAAWLETWYRAHTDDWRPGTQRVYRHAIDRWIVPAFGKTKLDALTPNVVQRWVHGHTEDGPRRMLTTARIVLKAALDWAMTQRLLTYNPAALVRVPSPVAKRAAPLTIAQARALADACGAHRLGGLVLASLTLGLRVGEACGLAWADVDFPAGTLKIRQQVQPDRRLTLVPLKTAASRRTLAMPAQLVAALKAQQTRQRADRLKAGARWSHVGDLVFTTPTGGMVSPEQARGALVELLTAAGLPRVRFHALRHTAATMLLMDGAPLFDVSRILGHGSIETTANIYGHLVPDMTAGAAARMDRLFSS